MLQLQLLYLFEEAVDQAGPPFLEPSHELAHFLLFAIALRPAFLEFCQVGAALPEDVHGRVHRHATPATATPASGVGAAFNSMCPTPKLPPLVHETARDVVDAVRQKSTRTGYDDLVVAAHAIDVHTAQELGLRHVEEHGHLPRTHVEHILEMVSRRPERGADVEPGLGHQLVRELEVALVQVRRVALPEAVRRRAYHDGALQVEDGDALQHVVVQPERAATETAVLEPHRNAPHRVPGFRDVVHHEIGPRKDGVPLQERPRHAPDPPLWRRTTKNSCPRGRAGMMPAAPFFF